MKQYRKYAFKVLNVRVTMHVPAYAIVILTLILQYGDKFIEDHSRRELEELT